MKYSSTSLCALAITLALTCTAVSEPRYSELWGKTGEKWTPQSRLPDFSFAGYHFGEDPLPTVDIAANVRDFGAKGDGKHDDTEAFKRAIDETESGAILIPEGRYVISDILWIKKPNIVLRGEGPDKTKLLFPKSLEDVRPAPGQTTSGRPTSNYSWSGGFIWAKGSYRLKPISPITSETLRGDSVLMLDKAASLKVGQRVAVEVSDTDDKTLLNHLYAGDPGDTGMVTKPIRIRFVSRIVEIEGKQVTLERPLRFDIRKEWKPRLLKFNPTVSEVGIEQLSFVFPNTPYEGHFTEGGRNAVAFNGTSDCWVRNVRIHNSDSGIYLSGMFCTADRILISAVRKANGGTTGHHGVSFGTDCMLSHFDFRTHFIHDITLGYLSAGNVAKNGKGTNLSFDHHKKANHENLFCNIDAGLGADLWHCGGGAELGKHCGAHGTFWGIRAEQELKWPRSNFGPDAMNLIGLQTSAPSRTGPTGKWFEAIPPKQLRPDDLHAAQLERRLKTR